MTQSFTSSSGAKYLNSSQIPTAVTYPTITGTVNRQGDRVKQFVYTNASTTSSAPILQFVAPEDGVIIGITYANGSVACDGTNGWGLPFINKSNSDASVAYFGFGSNTNAAAATDKTTVAANGKGELANSITTRINRGDVISCTSVRDGSSIVGTFIVHYSCETVGR